MHDYLTLLAVQTDDAGKYTELLLLYRWSAFFHGFSAAREGRRKTAIRSRRAN